MAFALALSGIAQAAWMAASATAAQQSPGFRQPFAQPPGMGGMDAELQFGDSRDRVKVSMFASQDKVAAGGDVVIAVVMDHDIGWHSWTNPGNTPEGMAVFSGAINTEIAVKTADGSPLRAHDGFIQWPGVYGATANIGEGPREYATFAGRAITYLPVSIAADAATGEVWLDVTLSFQSCDDKQCLAPTDVTERVLLQVVDAASLATSPPTLIHESDFAKFDPMVWPEIHSGATPHGASASGAGTSTEAAATTAGAATSAPRPTFFGISLPRTEGALGVVVLAILSMIGGFILNLTPCVLPIIPIKILTISQHAQTPGRGLMLGVWMALGVVAFWAGIGIPAALFTAAADPSRMFGIWWLTLAIGLLIGAMGVGIMGLFTIQLPTAVYAVNPKADSASGSFLFGVMTAVLGLPCFGFVAGALLAGSATLPPAVIMIIFTSIGIGMAAPYLVLAAKPGLVERIPRTGPASELVKQVMGLLLLAAAAYFVGSGLITLVIDQPYIGKQLHWWAVAVFTIAAGFWMVMRTMQISKAAAPRAIFGLLGIVLAAIAMFFAWDRTATSRVEWERLQASSRSSDGFVAGAWNHYTPERFEAARAAGHIVVLDFTATWCITCQVLKATVLDPDPVKSAFEQKDVVVFEVDLTSNKAPGWGLLRSLGKSGIPLLAVYTPGVDRPWDANAYTAGEVIGALDQARTQSKRVASK